MSPHHFDFHPDQAVGAFAAQYPCFVEFWQDQVTPDIRNLAAECSWRQACASVGRDADELLGLFALKVPAIEIPEERDWTSVTLDELVHNIVTYHHVFVRTQLGRMAAMVRYLAAIYPSERMDRVRSALAHLSQRWLAHLEMEERDFFPICLRLESNRDSLTRDELDDLVNALHQTAHDHRDIDQLAERAEQTIAMVRDDVATDHPAMIMGLEKAIRAFVDDCKVHAGKEDDILLPAVMFVHDIRRSDSESGRFSTRQ